MAKVNGKTLVATDQHLGYAKSNAQDFQGFLDYVSGRDDVGTLMMLGDFIDMWRRDASGLFLETREIVDKLVEIQSTRKVYFIVGNHDYHLRKLEDHGYPFQFLEKMAPINVGSISYRFTHGWEFDPEQQPLIMEAMCKNFSDQAGAERSEIYNAFTDFPNMLKNFFGAHGGHDKLINHLLQGPESRLSAALPTVEKTAYSNLKPGELLVFGHTHRPFVSADGRLANAGSWVTDANPNNTFVELDGSQVKLFVFSAAGITEITDRKPLAELT